MTEAIPSSPQPWSPLPLVRVLVLNAVPLYGVFVAGWSWGTILALYWFESFLGGLFILLRMTIHRSLTRKRGYWRGQLGLTVSTNDSQPRGFKSFIAEFLTATLVFNLAHGVFLALLLGLMLDKDPGAVIDLPALKRGVTVIALLLLGAFVIDLQGIRDRPFSWLRGMAQQAMSRTFVIHLAIILGMFGFAMMGTSRTLFGVFAVLKLVLEVGGSLPPRQMPADAPSWAPGIAGKVTPGEDLQAQWQRGVKKETRLEEEDEQAML